MDPESKKLLEETLELVKENNKMLHKVRSLQNWQQFWSFLKVLLIVGIALGSFYFLEPYLEKVMTVFNQVSGIKTNIDSTTLQNMFKKM